MSQTHFPAVPVSSDGPLRRRCRQCWKRRPDSAFVSRGGRIVRMCARCRERRVGGGYARKGRPRGLVRGALRVTFARVSQNRKTGPIPVSTTSASTCPPSCSFYGKGCYAEFFYLRILWSKVPSVGLTWGAFCKRVAELPPGQLWRHNQAGDLPGIGEHLDLRALRQLVRANAGRMGFTFTHKRLRTAAQRAAVRAANASGFTINLSADSLEHADELARLEVGPVTVVLQEDGGKTRTPEGRRVIVCPAQTSEDMTCERCKLCARPQRKAIVGFLAHGQGAKQVSELVQLRKRPAA